jgi:hypothetical protein
MPLPFPLALCWGRTRRACSTLVASPISGGQRADTIGRELA